MASTRNTLEQLSTNIHESMGLRRVEPVTPLSPISSAKDIGRLPLRTFGKLDVDRIMPDPQQPRVSFEDTEIERLARSIQTHGQLHPIRVRWDEPLGKWIIVSGERRWRATKSAGLAKIDCYFVEDKVSDAEVREQQLVENLLRKDLKPIEEAKAYQALMELNGWNGKQVAAALHVSTSRVSRALALLDLPEPVQQRIDDGTLSKSSAYEITKLPDRHVQSDLAKEAANSAMSHSQAVRRVKQRRGKKSPNPRKGLHQVFYADNGITVTVASRSKVNYHEVEQALLEVIDEVRHRIKNGIQLY